MEIALTYVYGIGRTTASEICAGTGIDESTRVRDLTDAEVTKLRGYIEEHVEVEGDLGPQGYVLDFGIVRDVVRKWVDDHLDHRMLLCQADPIVPILQAQGEPLFLMEENPTAENIAKVIFRHGNSAGLPITEIRLWETPSSYAAYRE